MQTDSPPPSPALRTDAALLAVARILRTARRRRAMLFPGAPVIFQEPAWTLLLELYIAQVEQAMPAFADLAASADTPLGTARRWATTLAELGLVTYGPGDAGPGDAVRGGTAPDDTAPDDTAAPRLTQRGIVAMRAYLSGF